MNFFTFNTIYNNCVYFLLAVLRLIQGVMANIGLTKHFFPCSQIIITPADLLLATITSISRASIFQTPQCRAQSQDNSQSNLPILQDVHKSSLHTRIKHQCDGVAVPNVSADTIELALFPF
ncbi:hypothetical protein BDA96_06G239900 [Sorghum bicolor]|uniref:Uncharacterized protein n=2 Tax=Sorghum bicolor TaxID=4558 RepID=A0A921QSU2_SORBI|nr:hypothetical protein BDA96_06G239900 [Sorghum bicolor]OQU82352.1 hypothetical protein SORBI_3006G219150 [Sorghum bicolor]